MLKWSDLLPDDATCDARHRDVVVGGVTADSRAVKAGDLFVAIPGTKVDGLRFVDAAIAAGAVAIIGERAPDTPLPAGIAFARITDVRRALALAAAKFHPR